MLFNKTIEGITRFDFRYTYGNGRDSFVQYVVLEGGGVYAASVKSQNDSADQRAEFEITPEAVKRLESFLNENKVGKWDGFNKSNKMVLDGYSFSLYIKTENGTSVEAHGYMRYPSNYKEVRQGLDGLFEELYRGFGRP